MKIRTVGAEFRTDGRTDGRSQYSLFAIFRMRLKTGRQWLDTVGEGGRLYWEPRSTTDCSA
jgi:hypothetical protein